MLSILSLGDEYSTNAQRYLAKIAKCDSVEITVGNLCMKNATLQKHLDAMKNDAPDYCFEYYDRGSVRLDTEEKCSISQVLAWDRWNYITIQQGGALAGDSDSFFPYICEIADELRTASPNSSLILNETWAFAKSCTHEEFLLYDNDQKNMIDKIRAAYILAAEKTGINIVFPIGEAWQRARSTQIGDNLTSDGRHADRMGEFLTGAVWYEILTGNNIEKNSYRLPFVPGDYVTVLKHIAHEIAEEYKIHR